MADGDEKEPTSVLLTPQSVVYCGACGMPPEYCEYGPDFETDCEPWLVKHHPDLAERLAAARGKSIKAAAAPSEATEKPPKPAEPWTMPQRLAAFYEKYAPEKLDSIDTILEKYAGKEEKLFLALTKKYGPEPKDPYFSDESDDDDDSDEEGAESDQEGHNELSPEERKKRRGAGAKKEKAKTIKVVIKKVSQKKKRHQTIVSGMETAGHKLKDVSKAFSKKFAGSSSVKDNTIIVQGDHTFELAELIADKFDIPESAISLDLDGEVVPFR